MIDSAKPSKRKPRVYLQLPGVPDIEITDKRVLDSLPNWAKGLGND